MNRRPSAFVLSACSVLVSVAAIAAEAPKPAAPPAKAVSAGATDQFATVEGVSISAAEYDSALRNAARQKFYHGTPPESQINELRHDVGIKLIDRILLVRTAKERKLSPDKTAVDSQIAQYEKQYKDSPRWQEQRESVLPNLRARLEEDSLLAELEKQVRKLPAATEAQVREYYKANPDKFTEPEKLQLGIILLTVDPSSPTAIWKLAVEEAERIHARLKEGADFAELAALHSSDESAKTGGLMEYIHRGMTPDALQDKIDGMKPGELSEPLRILEGVAIFKLIDRKQPIHHSFERVKERAGDLYERERTEKAWVDFKDGLRKRAKLVINTERYPVFAEFGATKAPAKAN